MIDLHSHILPGIDDGAIDLAASLKMASLYVANGFRQVVATPHALPEAIGKDWAQSLQRQVARLNQALRDESISLKITAGMEIAMTAEVPDLLDAGILLPLAGSRHVLIEPPFERLPVHWEQILFQIAGRGYRVLLAHPERCAQLFRNHDLFDRIIAMGVHLQVNWGSFMGVYGRATVKTARYLARKGYVHCLATDSHDHLDRSADIVDRAAPRISALIGTPNFDLLSRQNPARVITDQPLETMSSANMPGMPTKGWKSWIFRQR